MKSSKPYQATEQSSILMTPAKIHIIKHDQELTKLLETGDGEERVPKRAVLNKKFKWYYQIRWYILEN